MEFWHDAITEKSFAALQSLQRDIHFVLIGGWAAYVYTHTLKSRDIDILVDLPTLGQLKQRYAVVKNDRLKKYEIKGDGFDIDIYIPHWSIFVLPVTVIMKHTKKQDGFTVPLPEVLFSLKLSAYRERKGSLKGKKDAIDVMSLLQSGVVDLHKWKALVAAHDIHTLVGELRALVHTMVEMPEIGLHQKAYADLKRRTLHELDTRQ